MADPKRRRRVVGVVLACLVLFGVWYHIPLHRTLETEVHDNDGASAVLQMDITLHRSFFRGTVVRGTIEMDGVSYVSARGIEPKPSSFLDGLKTKWSGIISSGYFVEAERLAGLGIATYMMEDSLFIVDVSFRGFYDSIEALLLVRRIPDAPSVCYTVDLPTLLGN
mgnify:CR=1 FL=1